jgi:hypothetical protein
MRNAIAREPGVAPATPSRNDSADQSAPPIRAYSVAAFCKTFSFGRTKAWELVRTGKLRSVKIAGKRLIPADAAEDLIRTPPPSSPQPAACESAY